MRTKLLLFAFSITIGYTSFSQVSIKDSMALVDFYDSTNGDNWYNHYNWKTTAPVSSWYGVSIKNNRVSGINLVGNNLTGYIPSSFGNLDSLTFSNLHDSHLNGPLPASFGNLFALTNLNLSATGITAIPENFGNLQNLQNLELWGNQLSSLPSSFKKLNNIIALDIEDNQLSGDISLVMPDSLQAFAIGVNRLNFTPIEKMLVYNAKYESYYTPQAKIPIYTSGDSMWVAAGGTLSNNTYRWFKTGQGLITTIKGDSVYKPASAGNYYAEIDNSIAVNLTLASNSSDAAAAVIDACPATNVFLTANLIGTGYQWQQSIDSIHYINITDNSNFSGTSTASLTIKNIVATAYGNRYRCIVDGKESIFFTLVFRNKWIGGNNSDWQNAANWSCAAVPDENTDVVIENGTVIVDINTSIRSLHLFPGVIFSVNPGKILTIKYK